MGAFNGSGVFVRSYSWTNDAANGIDITASRVDTEDTGFASGLSICVTRDGQGQMAADFSPSSDATYNLGTGSFRWVNLSLSGGVTAAGTSQLANLTVTGGVTIGLLNLRGSTTVVKASNTTRSTTTSPSADPDLQIGLAAGTYSFELWITDGNGATSPGGLRGGIAFSGTSTSTTWGWGSTGSGTGTIASPMVTIGAVNQQLQSSQNGQANILIMGSIVVTVSGTLSFNWAQQSSNGTASIVSAGSWMRVTKLA